MKVLVFGAGGHGQVVADVLQTQARAGEQVEFIGFVDDRIDRVHDGRSGPGVLGTLSDWPTIVHDALIVAIGDNGVRRRVFEEAARRGARFAIAKHPSAVVACDVRVDPGTMICAGVVVNPRAVIGANTILNTASSVDHHCRVADHVHIGPGVRLGGDVEIGEGALLGIGAVVLPGLKVGGWAVVGAGAVVITDVLPGTTVAGVPAKLLGSSG